MGETLAMVFAGSPNFELRTAETVARGSSRWRSNPDRWTIIRVSPVSERCVSEVGSVHMRLFRLRGTRDSHWSASTLFLVQVSLALESLDRNSVENERLGTMAAAEA